MKRTVLAIITILLSSAFVMDAHAARICKSSSVSSSIKGATKKSTRHKARVQWGMTVGEKYSHKWSNWSNAKSRSTKCKKKTGPVGINEYVCKAKAKPCYYN